MPGRHGPNLLSEKDYEDFSNNKAPDKGIEEWLNEKTDGLMGALWHFAINLCRELQTGENAFTASDAYWMGAVDEVYGTTLLGERALAEAEVPDEE